MKKKDILSLSNILKAINFQKQSSKLNEININGISELSKAKKHQITFFSNIKYLDKLKKSKASAIFISDKYKKHVPKKIIVLKSAQPEIDFIKVANIFFPDSYFSKISYLHLTEKQIIKKYPSLKFGKNFYIENNVKIGKNVFIGNNVTIKNNCKIGSDVVIGSNVVIEHAEISNNVHICDGAIIGKKGFGFKFINDKCLRIPHIGKVIVGKDCEIGANSIIDRGSVKNTIIGEKTFLDNFVHIAHNVTIGKKCIFAAQTGVAGSTSIGDNVIIGGQAGISGHLKIGNNVKIGGKSGVVKDIKDNEIVMGYPAKSLRQFMKENS